MTNFFACLDPYIPVIQLLAGSIYVVYFLDQHMEDPFKEAHDELKKKYAAFSNKYQGSLQEKQRKHLVKLRTHNELWWENALKSLSALTLFSFLFCISVLMYAANETHFTLAGYTFSLRITSYLAFGYMFLIFLLYGNVGKYGKFVKNSYTAFIIFILLIATFSLSRNIWYCPDTPSPSVNSTNLLALCVCVTGLVIRYFVNLLHHCAIKVRIWKLRKLEKWLKEVDCIIDTISASITDTHKEIPPNAINRLSKDTKDKIVTSSLQGDLTIRTAMTMIDEEVSAIYDRVMRGFLWRWWNKILMMVKSANK